MACEFSGKIDELLAEHKHIASVAFISTSGYPLTKVVKVHHEKELVVMFPKCELMLESIAANPHVSVQFGCPMTEHVVVTGSIRAHKYAEKPDLFKHVFTECMKPKFSGPEDPNLILATVTVTESKVMPGCCCGVEKDGKCCAEKKECCAEKKECCK